MNLSRDNYSTPLPYIISRRIREYDIAKANANIMLYKGAISLDEYNYALSLDRDGRQIYLGLKQQDKDISEALKEGFTEFRTKFFESNNLSDIDIVSIRKDAIFVLDKICHYTKFDNIEFVLKNTYTSYIRIKGLDIFYYLDPVNNYENIDVKGIDDKNLPLHANAMLTFLCTVFDMIQSHSIKDTIECIYQFSEKYKKRELPIEYYREFNADCMYRMTVNGCNYLMSFITESEIPYINISENYKFIMELYKIVTSIYYQHK